MHKLNKHEKHYGSQILPSERSNQNAADRWIDEHFAFFNLNECKTIHYHKHINPSPFHFLHRTMYCTYIKRELNIILQTRVDNTITWKIQKQLDVSSKGPSFVSFSY